MGQWLEGSLPPFDRIEPVAYGTAAHFLQHRLQEHRSGQADHRLFLYPYWLLSHWLARGAPTPN
jgi:hypothetical protein